jgi:hypothetical protein
MKGIVGSPVEIINFYNAEMSLQYQDITSLEFRNHEGVWMPMTRKSLQGETVDLGPSREFGQGGGLEFSL